MEGHRDITATKQQKAVNDWIKPHEEAFFTEKREFARFRVSEESGWLLYAADDQLTEQVFGLNNDCYMVMVLIKWISKLPTIENARKQK